jgi:uncharacterized protein YraI
MFELGSEHHPIEIMFCPAAYTWCHIWTINMKCSVWTSQRLLKVSNAVKEEQVQFIGADPDTIDLPSIVFIGGLALHKNLHERM